MGRRVSTPSPRHEGARASGAGARVGCGWGRGDARARVPRKRRRRVPRCRSCPSRRRRPRRTRRSPCLCHLDAFWQRARARSRFFTARRLSVDVSRLLLASAAPAGPRYGAAPGRTRGSPGRGQNTQDDFPLATLSWDPLWLLCGSAEEREPAEGSCLTSGRKTLANQWRGKSDVKCLSCDPIATQL